MIPPDIEAVALLGWHVYPSSQYSRAACFKGATEAATCDLDTISNWCRDYPDCGWRVVFGPSHLTGIDCDVPPLHKHDGVATLRGLIDQNGPIPPRPVMRSGSGGLALFFRDIGIPLRGTTNFVPGIDPRRGALTQNIPPTVHLVTKRPYVWLRPPWEITPPAMPAWLVDLLRQPNEPSRRPPPELPAGDRLRNYGVAALHNAIRRVAATGKGARNSTLNAEAYGLARLVHQGAITETEVRECLIAAAHANGMTADDGVRAALLTIDSGLKSRRK